MRLLMILILAGVVPAQVYTWADALHAIRTVETGGCKNGGIGARGDNGHAIGPFQIHRAYWKDAAERDRTLTDYSTCLTSRRYSQRVVIAYMRRYCPKSAAAFDKGSATEADVQRISRVHNGGPRGYAKRATLGYWLKIRRALYGKLGRKLKGKD
mgnify:CR=1 FL=1